MWTPEGDSPFGSMGLESDVLDDRLAILEAIGRYSYAYDGRDADAFASLFTEAVSRWGVDVKSVEIREIAPQRDIQEAMTLLLTADRTKRSEITQSEGSRQAAINVAEGNKQAAILEVEGVRESSILRAEGTRQAQILQAEGFSIGLERIYETASHVDSNTMGLQYLEMMKTLGEGESTKWIIPMDLASMAGTLSGSLMGVAGGNSDGTDGES